MKIRLTLLTLLFISQNSWGARLPPNESLILASLDQYEKILSAWFINKKCRFISAKEEKTLEHNLATIASKLRKDIGDSKQLTQTLLNAKKVPEQAPFSSCGDDAIKQVNFGAEQAQRWQEKINTNAK